MDQITLEKIEKLIELKNENICDCCLGRKFSNVLKFKESKTIEKDGKGKKEKETQNKNEVVEKIDGNKERGELIKKTLSKEDYDFETLDKCEVCDDLLLKIQKYNENGTMINRILEKINYLNLEFDTFLIGSKIPNNILKRDEELNESLDLDVENIKKEINREIGKLFETSLNKEVDFENPDIVIIVDLRKILINSSQSDEYTKSSESSKIDVSIEPIRSKNSTKIDDIKVKIQINPIFIEGKYKKLIRGIPQTKWPCRKCKGRGCSECNGTGKIYDESVEELISDIILKEARGYEAKFHGAGREDIDVRMLGTGRPFVLEIKEPKVRKLDLDKITKEVNKYSEGKTEYIDLKYTERKRKAEIKVSSSDIFKVYRVLVECGENITEEELSKIREKLENKIIDQQTPQRVAHRRADKIRKRGIKELSTKFLTSKTFEMTIKAQGGLYIKELISSDDNRTRPSVSEILGTKTICKELDVIALG